MTTRNRATSSTSMIPPVSPPYGVRGSGPAPAAGRRSCQRLLAYRQATTVIVRERGYGHILGGRGPGGTGHPAGTAEPDLRHRVHRAVHGLDRPDHRGHRPARPPEKTHTPDH